MLLTLNIGNSSLRFGVFEGRACMARWLIKSKPHRSSDEYIVSIHSMLTEHGLNIKDVKRIIAASVVPELTGVMREAFQGLFGIDPRFISHRMKSGLTFPINNPDELGADLLANGAASGSEEKESDIRAYRS